MKHKRIEKIEYQRFQGGMWLPVKNTDNVSVEIDSGSDVIACGTPESWDVLPPMIDYPLITIHQGDWRFPVHDVRITEIGIESIRARYEQDLCPACANSAEPD